MHRLATTALLALASAAAAQTYSITTVDLGGDLVGGWATDLTDDGRVAGASTIEGGRRTQGFIWAGGAIQQLVVPQPGNFGVRPRYLDIHHHVLVFSITEGGYYAGAGTNVDFGLSLQPYFAWLPSADPYPAQFVAAEDVGSAMVFDIADTFPRATAVGAGFRTGNLRVGFISTVSKIDDVGNPPRVTFLTGFGGPTSPAGAFSVNNAGDVVGFAADAAGIHRAFFRPASTGVMSDMGTLGGPSADAYAISDAGHVVGKADVALGRHHAFLRAPGSSALTDLGTLGGAVSTARAVNDAGTVVGESWTADGLVHAFIYQNGQMRDLNSAIPPSSGWTLSYASAINSSGWITGWGMLAGKTRGFLLKPAPACYPDCNGDGALNLADFGCFQTRFALGDPYADCNGDGVRNLSDFGCFQTRFALGCP